MNERKLFPHQVVGIEFLKKKKRAILADSPGLGKTLQAIKAAGETSNATILVICPASLKINWEREIHMVYPEDIVTVVDSSPGWKLFYTATWVVINYDILAKHPELAEETKLGRIETVILDEAHYIKNHTSIRSKEALAICENAKQVYCLTGTPVINKPIELYSLLQAVKHPLTQNTEKSPSALRAQYSKRYCDGHLEVIHRRGGGVLRFWDESGANRLPELKALTTDAILRRTKDEVLDLPEKIISVVECEMDAEHQKSYDSAWEEYLEFIAKNPLKKDFDNILDARSLVELIKLKQVCSKAKIKRIVDDIENMVEQGEKVIVFTQFTGTVDTLMAILAKKKIGAVRLTGQNDTEERQKAVDEFQNKENIKVFVANIKAGGVGITLTAANHVIFADMDWSPAIHEQCEDRCHRIGTTGTVNVYYYIISGTIEEDILEVLNTKRDIIKQLIDGNFEYNDNEALGEFARKLSNRMIKRV